MSVSQIVLDAFAIEAKVGNLSDREGRSTRFGDVVLIPNQTTVECEWKAQLMTGLASEHH